MKNVYLTIVAILFAIVAHSQTISGTYTVCVGGTETLTESPAGGTWSSSDAAVAQVYSGGIYQGHTAGTATLTYTTGTGSVTTTVTVNQVVAPITGTPVVCQGSTTSLACADAGGIWNSNNTLIATVDPSGVVTGNYGYGYTRINYVLPSGCYSYVQVTVNATPTPITGPGLICVGSPGTLASTPAGGSWTTSNTAVATVGSGTGVVIGIVADTVNITYSLGTGCSASRTVTITPLPPPMTGLTTVCEGSSATLTIGMTGGTWTSSNASVATIGSTTGVATGIVAGTTVITYALPMTGCVSVRVLTVNANPVAITGPNPICMGSGGAQSCATPGGTWSSSNVLIPIGSATGIITATNPGTSIITYTTGPGCYSTRVVTVNPLPGAITGSATVCVGSSVSLNCSTPGGTWSVSIPTKASIDISTGVATGIAAGTTNISYTVTSTGCRSITILTVAPSPSAISGTSSLCVGTTTTLMCMTPGGTWSSSSAVATVSSTTGIVSGITAGTPNISYTIAGGCFAINTVTVYPLPAPISGPTTVCVGSSATLTIGMTGGTWTSANTSVATIGSTTGVATGIVAGTTVITYALPMTGCVSVRVLTVNPNPAAITGPGTLCSGSSTSLSGLPAGGSWSSMDVVICVPTPGGIITGLAPGVTTITYTAPTTGCFAVKTVTVNAAPDTITGPGSICLGSTTTYGSASTGGTWTSSASTIVAVSPASGFVYAVATGTATITYTIPSGCYATKTVTVVPNPAAITGPAAICDGTTGTMSCITPGGTWSSSFSGIAAISGSGIAVGIASGATNISYTTSLGCYSTAVLTVNPYPSAIAGTLYICSGSTTTLSSTTGGGSWASSNSSIASIAPATGIVTGIAPGITTITYTLATGCFTMAEITVNAVPAAITGSGAVCALTTLTLSDATPGGIWSSSDPTILMVPDPIIGAVTPVTMGTATITYMLPSGCIAIHTVTVTPAPSPITGPGEVCDGSTVSLGNTVSGGTWFSSDPAIASITSGGIVTGNDPGVVTISYTLSLGCSTGVSLTVNTTPAAITGLGSVCVGSTVTLNCATPGGTWVSSDYTMASIGSATGIVMGNAPSDTSLKMQYVLSTGCMASMHFTVNATPAAITGAASVCAGSTVTESCTTPGGVWTSSNTVVASIGLTTGVVMGNAAGAVTLTYTLGTSCYATRSFTVNAAPAPITGLSEVCVGGSVTVSSVTTGGTWASSDIAVATIDATGIVTSVSPGTTTISYTLATGCTATKIFTVHPLPSAITGTASLCAGGTGTLSSTTTGGTWSSSAPAVATIDPTGVVTAVVAGTSTVSYTLLTGCSTSIIVTVSTMPGSITGASAVCEGLTITLGSTPAGGTWSSSNPTVAEVPLTTGVVSGLAAGTTTITYATSSSCFSTETITVNTTPAPITGPSAVCQGSTITLSSTTPGGSWLSSVVGAAVVSPGTGIVTGVSSGTTAITYYLGTSCLSSTTITVNDTPVVSATAAPSACGPLYTATATGATTYSWSPTTGIASGSTSDVAYIYAGDPVTYTITGTSLGCSGIGTITISANRILGHLSFGGPTPSGTSARVWLIQYNTTDSTIIAQDSMLTCMDGDAPYYEFTGKPAGSYLVKAKLMSSMPGTSDYIPTYGTSAATWDVAAPITHSAASDSQHIAMLYGTVPSGPGFISGYVYMGAGKGTASEVPVKNMVIYLENTLGQVLTYTYTDASGAYSFSSVAAGSYLIHPEEMSYNTIPAPVTVSAGSPADGIGFKKHTSTGLISPWTMPAAVKQVTTVDIEIYPNPTNDMVVIGNAIGKEVTITDVTGREVYKTKITSGQQPVSLAGMASGIYIITARSNGAELQRIRLVKQ